MPDIMQIPELKDLSKEEQRAQAIKWLMEELAEAEQSAKDFGWIDFEDVKKELGIV